MERKIGEVFEFEGEKLQVVEESRECHGRYFEKKKNVLIIGVLLVSAIHRGEKTINV